jgi:hypothetical protein
VRGRAGPPTTTAPHRTGPLLFMSSSAARRRRARRTAYGVRHVMDQRRTAAPCHDGSASRDVAASAAARLSVHQGFKQDIIV